MKTGYKDSFLSCFDETLEIPDSKILWFILEIVSELEDENRNTDTDQPDEEIGGRYNTGGYDGVLLVPVGSYGDPELLGRTILCVI